MSQKEKLIQRFLSVPSDFTYNELVRLLSFFGYEADEDRNGSRVCFFNPNTKDVIDLHKPHPGNIVKKYIINNTNRLLRERGQL